MGIKAGAYEHWLTLESYNIKYTDHQIDVDTISAAVAQEIQGTGVLYFLLC